VVLLRIPLLLGVITQVQQPQWGWTGRGKLRQYFSGALPTQDARFHHFPLKVLNPKFHIVKEIVSRVERDECVSKLGIHLQILVLNALYMLIFFNVSPLT